MPYLGCPSSGRAFQLYTVRADDRLMGAWGEPDDRTVYDDAHRIAQLADQARRSILDAELGEAVGQDARRIREAVLCQDASGNALAISEAARYVRPSIGPRVDLIWRDPAVRAAYELLALPLPAWFALPRCRYLGGFSEFPDPIAGLDLVGVAPLTIAAYRPGGTALFGIPGHMVVGLAIEGPEQIAQRVTVPRVLVLGPLAWAVKKDVPRAFLVVETDRAIDVYFETAAASPHELRARLAPVMREFAAADDAPRVATGAPGGRGAIDPVQRLRDMAALRDDGILTEEEYELQKSELLQTMRADLTR